MGENGEDFDFGTAAMRMLEGIRRNDEDDPRNQRIEEVEEPDSPTPQGSGGGMILAPQPRSGEVERSAEARSNEDILKMGRQSTSSSRRAYPDQVVEEEANHEGQDEKSEELEYIDVDQLKEEE
jgi:hypothetical protein